MTQSPGAFEIAQALIIIVPLLLVVAAWYFRRWRPRRYNARRPKKRSRRA